MNSEVALHEDLSRTWGIVHTQKLLQSSCGHKDNSLRVHTTRGRHIGDLGWSTTQALWTFLLSITGPQCPPLFKSAWIRFPMTCNQIGLKRSTQSNGCLRFAASISSCRHPGQTTWIWERLFCSKCPISHPIYSLKIITQCLFQLRIDMKVSIHI